MRANTLKLGLSYLIFVSIITCQTKDICEYRGIKWETNLDNSYIFLANQTIPDSLWANEYNPEGIYDLEKQISDDDSEINFSEFITGLGPVKFKLIFPNHKFEKVQYKVPSGIDGFNFIKKVLLSKFGKPTKVIQEKETIFGKPLPKYLWRFPSAEITLRYEPSDGYASSSGWSDVTYLSSALLKRLEKKEKEYQKKVINQSKGKF